MISDKKKTVQNLKNQSVRSQHPPTPNHTTHKLPLTSFNSQNQVLHVIQKFKVGGKAHVKDESIKTFQGKGKSENTW